MKNGLIVNRYGTRRYYLNDELHRVDGGPAEEYINGSKYWYLHGKKHREDGPASEWEDGTKLWYLNDKLHREDGPAVEETDGAKRWYLNGKEIEYPEEFYTLEEWFQYLNDNEEYSLQWISDINGLIGFIKNPTDKQTRLNAMRWKI